MPAQAGSSDNHLTIIFIRNDKNSSKKPAGYTSKIPADRRRVFARFSLFPRDIVIVNCTGFSHPLVRDPMQHPSTDVSIAANLPAGNFQPDFLRFMNH